MIDHSTTTRMVMPRAEVEMSTERILWRCRKCKSIIGDSNYEVVIETKEPGCKRSRIICKNCKTINFVSHE